MFSDKSAKFLGGRKTQPMKQILHAKYIAVVLALAFASVAITAEAGVVTLATPFTINQNYGIKFLNFNGATLTGSDSAGANSVALQHVYGNLLLGSGGTSVYAASSGNPVTFSNGSVVSASSTAFNSSYASYNSISTASISYFVFAFYNNQGVNSTPGVNPNNDFIANSKLAWVAFSRTGSDLTVEAAQVNTVAGASITVGGGAAVPEIDPATGCSALSIVAGALALIEQRRRRAEFVA
jgi:hypothetical protein